MSHPIVPSEAAATEMITEIHAPVDSSNVRNVGVIRKAFTPSKKASKAAVWFAETCPRRRAVSLIS